jgi:hypothetical protein
MAAFGAKQPLVRHVVEITHRRRLFRKYDTLACHDGDLSLTLGDQRRRRLNLSLEYRIRLLRGIGDLRVANSASTDGPLVRFGDALRQIGVYAEKSLASSRHRTNGVCVVIQSCNDPRQAFVLRSRWLRSCRVSIKKCSRCGNKRATGASRCRPSAAMSSIGKKGHTKPINPGQSLKNIKLTIRLQGSTATCQLT